MSDISSQPVLDMGQLLSSYGQNQANIGLTQAQTGASQAGAGLTRAQTGLVGVQTQKAAFEVQMIRKAMAALDNMPSGEAEKSGEGKSSDPTETGVASSLNSKFFTDPMGPPGLQQYINGTAWVNPSEAQRAEEWRKTLVASQTAKNQNEANDIWQTSNSLSNGKQDHPLSSLLALRPGSYLNNVGKAIAQDSSKSPEEKDAAATMAIQAAAKYSHQYTGRETEMVGDQPVDKLTKLPVQAPRAPMTNAQNLEVGKFNATPQTATTENRTSTVYPKLQVGPDGRPVQSQASGGGTSKPRQLDVNDPTDLSEGLKRAGFRDDQISFVKDQPKAMGAIKGNQQLNDIDKKERDTYIDQRKKLALDTNTSAARAQDSLTHIKQIQGLMNTPGLTFGPGSHEYSQMQTFFNQWVGTSGGQAGAYQVLSKVLNASEMNDLLQQFHSEGAQVRLGAYESRLIMEKLAANPNLTKEAVNQMLQWQSSDAKYTMDKARVAGAVIATNKSVENFDKNYASKFPKQDLVDSTTDLLNHNKKLNFSGTNGKTYNVAEVKEAASRAGIPLLMFEEQLRKAGATIK